MKKQDDKTLGQRLGEAYREVGETFVNLAKAPRALWGINVSYFLEGLAYFGILTILGKYLSEDVGLADKHASLVYAVFTGGITAAMLILGGVTDKIGVRKAMLAALGVMVVGRLGLAASGTFFEYGGGAVSPMFFTVIAGLFVIMIGYGMYQPAAYAAVKQYTNKKTAAIGYAMIYALMNLGAFVSGFLSPPIRQEAGMVGVYWVYVVITVLAFAAVAFILTKRIAADAVARVKREDEEIEKAERAEKGEAETEKSEGEATEKKEPAPLAAAPARLLEPRVIAYAVMLVAGLVGWIYLMATEVDPPHVATVRAGAVSAGAPAGALGGLKTDGDPAKVGEALTKAEGELRTLAAELEVPTAGEELTVDGTAFAIVRAKLIADANYAAAIAKLSGAWTKPVPKDGRDGAHDRLRAHGVRSMALAYGLVAPVDGTVVDDLRRRMKRVDEDDGIPVTADEQADIVRHAGLDAPAMLAELSDDAAALETALSTQLGTLGPVLALSAVDQIGFVAALGDLTALKDMGAAGRDMLSQKLMADALVAITLANHLAEAGDDTLAAHFAGDHLGGASGLAKEGMLEAIQAAVMAPLGVRFQLWSVRYGPWVLGGLLGLLLLFTRVMRLRPDHPFHNGPFTFFIFILIPVQTLFAHNWLTLPYYIDRAFAGTAVGANFELFANLNPIFIFVLTPLVAAMTVRADVYKMMIWGTLIMAAPTFLLVLPPHWALLMTYIVLMSIGEAMWQPRFLQLVAEIAPEGKTGIYMGIAQLPWFLTKVVTGLYSGWFVGTYCPAVGPQNTQFMWLVHSGVAMITPFALIFAKGWIGKKITQKH